MAAVMVVGDQVLVWIRSRVDLDAASWDVQRAVVDEKDG